MIQDIAPRELRIEYEEKKPKDADLICIFSGREILSRIDENGISLPNLGELQLPEEALRYLLSTAEIEGAIEQSLFLYQGEERPEIEGYSYQEIRRIRGKKPEELTFALATAYHLSVWYRNNRFCGRCGQKMIHDQQERMVKCPSCGNMIYPKLMPAVIVGVIRGDKILVSRYAGRAYKGYALIAGFCEIGESFEQTVRREVMEEVGLKVKNIRYYKSQPWGFDQDLLAGFFCEAVGDPTIHMDENELSYAEWISREEMEQTMHDQVSLTGEMMECFRLGRLEVVRPQ
jgi:NAD+ diphosphatase